MLASRVEGSPIVAPGSTEGERFRLVHNPGRERDELLPHRSVCRPFSNNRTAEKVFMAEHNTSGRQLPKPPSLNDYLSKCVRFVQQQEATRGSRHYPYALEPLPLW